MVQPPEILTERLRLRRPRLDDAAEVFVYQSDPEVTRYLTFPTATDVSQAEEFLRRCDRVWEAGDAFPMAVTLRGNDHLIGMVEPRPTDHGVELGYVLQRSSWGHGFMTEAVRGVVEWALTHDDVFRIWAYVDVDNPASQRVLEKAGMVIEGTLHRWAQHVNASVEPSDAIMYATWR